MTGNTDIHAKRVLIVEDDAFIALDLEDVFIDAGFEVVGIAASVESALSLVRETEIDVAVLDYNLGVETSIAIAIELDSRGIPFLFLSGQTRRVVLDNSGIEPLVLNKPFIPAHLVTEIRKLFKQGG